MANAKDLKASLILGVQLLAYTILFLACANVLDKKEKIRRTIFLILIGAGFSAALGVVQAMIGSLTPTPVVNLFLRGNIAQLFLGTRNLERMGAFGAAGPDILYRGSGVEGVGNIFRSFGFFEGPTIYGWFSATVGILAFGLWYAKIKNSPRFRRAAIWAAGLSALTVFLSWTRSAWLALVIGAVCVVIFRRGQSISFKSKRWWFFGIAVVLCLGLLLVIGFLAPDSSVGRMITSSIGGEAASGSNASRLRTARFALAYIIDNPFGGVGLGNYPYLTSGGALTSDTATLATSHNTFLDLGVELGLPGAVAFIWLVLSLILGVKKPIQQPHGTFWHAMGVALAAVWLTFTVTFMFGGNIIHPKWMTYWWLLAGLQGAARHILSNIKNEPVTEDMSFQ